MTDGLRAGNGVLRIVGKTIFCFRPNRLPDIEMRHGLFTISQAFVAYYPRLGRQSYV